MKFYATGSFFGGLKSVFIFPFNQTSLPSLSMCSVSKVNIVYYLGMKRKIILIVLTLVFVSAGWVCGEWIRKKQIDFDGSTGEGVSDTSNALNSSNTSVLPPMPDDFVISQKKTVGEAFDEWNRERSLEEMLNEENGVIKAALFEKYAKDIPLEEFPELIKLIVENQGKLLKNATPMDFLSATALNAVLKVWMERDFEAAKDYMVNNITDNNNSMANQIGKLMMGTELISGWMKKDKEECVNFVKEQAEKNDKEMWAALFMLTSSKDYPEDTFQLFQDLGSAEAPGKKLNQQAQGIMYGMLFSSWYEKDANGALAQLGEMKDEGMRRAALTGILEKMTSQSPNEALSLIQSEWPENDQSEPLGILIQSYALDSPLDALEFIRQGDLSGDNRKAAVNGLVSVLNAQKLEEILQNDSLLLSDEERKELILGKLTGSANIKSVSMAIYANSMNSNSPEEIEATRSLFAQLPDADRAEALKKVIETRRAYQKEEMLFDVLESLSPEAKESMKGESAKLIESMTYNNPQLAADYFMKELGAGSIEDAKSMDMLSNITRSYLNKDPTEAVAWVNTLPEGEMRNQANLLCAVHNIEKNPQAAVFALENFGNKETAKEIFSNTVDSIAGKDPQLLAKILLEVKDSDLREEGVSSTYWKIRNISEGEMLAFIDDLGPKPDLQDEFRGKFIESTKGKNPELALELALEMQPNEENKKQIQALLTEFKKKDAARAKEWCEENGIQFDE